MGAVAKPSLGVQVSWGNTHVVIMILQAPEFSEHLEQCSLTVGGSQMAPHTYWGWVRAEGSVPTCRWRLVGESGRKLSCQGLWSLILLELLSQPSDPALLERIKVNMAHGNFHMWYLQGQQWCTPSLLLTQENLCPFLKYSSVLFTFLIFSIPFLQCISSSALWCFSFGTRFIGMWSFPPLDVLLHLPLAVLAPMGFLLYSASTVLSSCSRKSKAELQCQTTLDEKRKGWIWQLHEPASHSHLESS